MWKIHRYYLKEVATSATLTFTVLFGIVLVSTVYRGIKRAEGFGVVAAAKVTFFWAADTLPHLLPISLLFATVLTFARASQDREITAIRASGISPRVAMTSSLLVGIVFALLGSWALHWLVPQTHYMKYRVVADSIRSVLLTTGMTGDQFSYKGLMMTWEARDEAGHWHDVQILVHRDGSSLDLDQGLWLADEAWVEVVGEERLDLVLHNVRDAGQRYAHRGEVRGSISIRAISEGSRRNENERDMTSEQVLAEVYQGLHDNPVQALYSVHRRANFALLPLLFAPLGFCIGVMSRQRGRVLAMVFGMVPVIIFYVGDLLGTRMVRVTGEPWFTWTPTVLLTLIGLPFCWRLLRY